MLPYLLVFGFITLLSFLDYLKEFRKNRGFIFFSAVLTLIFFAGLRVEGIGSDDHNYVQIYESIPSFQELFSIDTKLSEYRKEIGYIIINVFIKSISDSYTILFLIIAIISVGLASHNYKKYSRFCFLTLLLFFVHPFLYRDMNQMRAAIALAICLYSIPYIEEKKFINFVIVILVASSFHLVAIAMFLPFVLSRFNIGRIKAIVMVLISFLLGFISISSVILSFIPAINSSITSSLINYSNSEMYSATLGMFNITNIKSMFIFTLLTIFYEKLIKRQPFFNTMYMMYALSLAWRIAFNDFAIIAGRVGTVFEIVEVILIPSFILLLSNKFLGHFFVVFYAFLMLCLNLYVVERRNYEWIVG
jgi:hypothetical protein